MAFKPSLGSVLVGVGLVAVAGVFVVPGGTSDEPGAQDTSSGDRQLNLVAYSVPKPGFETVIRGFRETEDGADIGFAESYGASADQSRKVVRHVPADVVNFSVEPDVTRLVDNDRVAADWRDNVPDDESGRSVPFGSLVSFITREGNPLGLENWDDLLEPGIEVISPNPGSSGSAKWNLLAPYAGWFFQEVDEGRDLAAAHDTASAKLEQLIGEHFQVRPKSAREAASAFHGGQGDVLLSYENEAIMMDRAGDDIDYSVPGDTFRIENPVAVVENEADGDADAEAATDFRDFMFGPDAERLWASEGFRPGPDLFDDAGETDVIDSLPQEQRDAFRPVDNVHTIDALAAAFRELFPELGSEGAEDIEDWGVVDRVLFNRADPGSGEDDGVVTTIYREV